MPKYFCVYGGYENQQEADKGVALIKEMPFDDLLRIFIHEVKAKDLEKAANFVEEEHPQEAVCYIAIFDREVARFQEEALLLEGRKGAGGLLLFVRCRHCHTLVIINGPDCQECGVNRELAGYERLTFESSF